MTPGLVYAADARYARAVEAAIPSGTEVLWGKDYPELAATPAGPRVDAAHQAIGAETISKFLLTSGSTGLPKAVVHTQRMLT